MSSRILAGRYELLEKIGDGGMAVVYKGKDKLLNRFIAVKILKPEFVRDVKFIENFRRESQSAASLSHPNIVNVYDVGREGNIHYIVMELVEGRVLSDVIREKGPLEVRWAVSIAKQVAAALAVAHKNHIIHRDVKPHNILITRDGVAKITDFGIAKAVNSGTIVGNQQGMIMGSVHYFSPEQARGGYVDEKSDIYSLGIVLYEMLTGKVPFDADNPVTVAVMHMNNEIQPPSTLVPGIPPDVEAVVMKATNKYQVNRYSDVIEMYRALEQANLNMVPPTGRNYNPSPDMAATRVMTAAEVSGALAASEAIPPSGVGDGSAARGQAAGQPSLEGTPNREKQEIQDYGDERRDKKNMGKNKKPKKKVRLNATKLLAVILALVCAVPASALLFKVVNGFTQTKDITVPKLVGMTQQEATDSLDKLGLKLKVEEPVISDDVEAGQIASQTPDAGETIKDGQTIRVNLNKGSDDGEVPDVTGKTLETAITLLQAKGFELGKSDEDFSDLPKGTIVSQNPTGKTKAEKGSAVDLVVSKGPKDVLVKVPSLENESLSNAKTLLSANNLTLGKTTLGDSNTVQKDHVISQSVAGGTEVAENTVIDLVISKGIPEKPATPAAVSITIPFDQAQQEVFFMTVVVSDDSGVNTPVDWQEEHKSDGSKTISLSGTGENGTVQVIFDKDNVMNFSVNFNTGTVTKN